MNWINNVVRPKIRSFLGSKSDMPENTWRTCPESGQMVYYKDLEANQFVFPGSEYHEQMDAPTRLKSIFDEGVYERVPVPEVAQDPLKFRDSRKYTDRLKTAKSQTEEDDAVLIGEGLIEGLRVVVAVQDFRFMAGSLGMAAGEAIIAGMQRALVSKTPFILFSASGGARMQEGILSLMQMPRTTITVQQLREAGLPYIVVLTNPTTGGVTASYAMLGDIQIAEPKALICFAGPRVIQQTIREQLPEGFQRSEYLLEHGMIDMVVHRHKLRDTIARLCGLLTSAEPVKVAQENINGAAHLNGAAVAEQAIEVASEETDAPKDTETDNDEVIEVEAQPVDDAERFAPEPTTAGKPEAGDAGDGADASTGHDGKQTN